MRTAVALFALLAAWPAAGVTLISVPARVAPAPVRVAPAPVRPATPPPRVAAPDPAARAAPRPPVAEPPPITSPSNPLWWMFFGPKPALSTTRCDPNDEKLRLNCKVRH